MNLEHMVWNERRVIRRGYISPTHEVQYVLDGVLWKEKFTHETTAFRFAERMMAEGVTSVTITKVG